jgi:hypothetical protein
MFNLSSNIKEKYIQCTTRTKLNASDINYRTIRVPCTAKLCNKTHHIYGSSGDLSNRSEYRKSHCHIFTDEIEIVIGPGTQRPFKIIN